MKLFMLALSGGLALFMAKPIDAATYRVDFSVTGTDGVIGTFTAPAGGGNVTNLTVLLSGVLFDTRIDAGGPFDYDPAAGDFVDYGDFPTYTNSIGVAGVCPATECLLQIYPLPGDPTPGDYLAIDASDNNIDDGTKYAIDPSPVPLPAPIALLAGGILALAGMRRQVRHDG